MARNYCAVPYDYLEEMETLDDGQFGRLIRALIAYSMTGDPIKLSGPERFFEKRVMNQEQRFQESYVSLSDKRSEAGKKGAKSRWQNGKTWQTIANDSKPWQGYGKNGNTETDTKLNQLVKKDTPISPRKKAVCHEADPRELEVLEYLNNKVGSRYHNSNNSLKHIRARLNEGFTVDDCKAVIDKKCQEWKNDAKMEQYLRPETLFGSKFENYLNAPVSSGGFGKRRDILPDYYDPDPQRVKEATAATQEELEEAYKALRRPAK